MPHSRTLVFCRGDGNAFVPTFASLSRQVFSLHFFPLDFNPLSFFTAHRPKSNEAFHQITLISPARRTVTIFCFIRKKKHITGLSFTDSCVRGENSSYFLRRTRLAVTPAIFIPCFFFFSCDVCVTNTLAATPQSERNTQSVWFPWFPPAGLYVDEALFYFLVDRIFFVDSPWRHHRSEASSIRPLPFVPGLFCSLSV